MPKSRNRSRDQKKRAQKKRNEKTRLERRHAEMIADRALTAQLYNESPRDLATYPIEVVKVYDELMGETK